MRPIGWLRQGPLANRNYVLFLCGAFISAMGSWMNTVALGWTVLQLSNSTFILGLMGFVQLAPVLLFGAWGGSWTQGPNTAVNGARQIYGGYSITVTCSGNGQTQSGTNSNWKP